MDPDAYDVRDARQRCFGFVGFSILLSWSAWAGLWAPGVHRWPGVATAIVTLGLWGPALATKLTLRLFRSRPMGGEGEAEEEPALPRDYLLSLVLAAGCCLTTLGLAIALGQGAWRWNWAPTGYSLVFIGSFNYLPMELYDLANAIGLAAQTIVAELGFALFAMILAAGAEIGFRGFLLPTVIRVGYRPWLAAIIVGAVWGVWWMPLVWRGDLTGFYSGEPLPGSAALLVASMAWGALLGWFYLRCRRLGPTVVAATFAAWFIGSLPCVSGAYNPLLFVDPRSLACAAIVAALSALLWHFAPPRPSGAPGD